jgi:hypothetical protein
LITNRLFLFMPAGDVDEELICPICSQVLEEPVQV